MRQRGVQYAIKVMTDRIGALAGLILIAPILLALPFLIWALLGPPVFFRQERPGRDGRIFQLVKFRTMTDARGRDGALLPDDQRLTWLGRLLRSTSLDELPQLWNVFRGDLSFVGPRPLLRAYLERYSKEQARRHEVKPGITGWAQVNGRNALTWEEKFALDVWYVDNWSLLVDAKIIGLTIWKVMRREGVSPQGSATMAEFLGTRRDEEL